MYKKVILFLLAILPLSESKLRDMTTMELTRDMGIGINLGNTLESCGDWIWEYGDHSVKSYETAWGSPVITKAMIEGIKKEGFGVMRLPVHWFNLMSNDYTINKDYMARAKEIVDWAMEAKLYVILNIHHDEKDFFKNMPSKTEETLKNYRKIWTQIADAFKDYDDYLMFESLNEEACWNDVFNQWSGSTNGKKEVFDYTYQLNQAFVDVVRSSGGNNQERHLLLAGYCTDPDLTCDSMFRMPKDPANRCAVSMHYYNPSTFCILTEDADWGKAQSTWGSNDEIKDLNKKFDKMKSTFIDKGIPVIIGEYGAATKNKDMSSVRNFLYSVCKAAYDRKMVPVLWDVTGEFYNRDKCVMNDSIIKEKLNSVKS